MTFYIGTNKITPSTVVNSGASGDVMNVLNLTGSTLSSGDKVWLSPMYLGSSTSSQISAGSTDVYQSNIAVVSKDGTSIYLPASGLIYNVENGSTTSAATVSSSNDERSIVKYTAAGDIVYYRGTYSSSNWYTVGGNSYGTPTNYGYAGDDYYRLDNNLVKMQHGTMTINKTYTFNNVSYFIDAPCFYTSTGNFYYYTKNNYYLSLAIIDDANLTVTYNKQLISDGISCSPQYTTSDGKYLICGNTLCSSYNVGSNSLRIFAISNDGSISEVSIENMSPDLINYYNSSSSFFTYNQQDDILTIGTTTSVLSFKYRNNNFTKLNGYTFESAINTAAIHLIFSSIDGSVMCTKAAGINKPYCIKSAGNAVYKVVNYQNANISTDSLTGKVIQGGASGEMIKVATIMP